MENSLVHAEEVLGQFPLCEASAALLIPCPDKKVDKCLLVGDNEQDQELYLFPIKNLKLDAKAQRAFDLHLDEEQKISDIEALTSVSADEILAFASHSRNSTCEIKKKRQQFGKVSLAKKQTTIVDTLKSKPVNCEYLFANQVLDTSMQAVCKAIDTAETNAEKIEAELKAKKIPEKDAKTRCNTVNAFNAEGAVALKTEKGAGVWIGLRAPLLHVHPEQPEKKNLAILLHLKDLSAYTFDRVAFIDLSERGIRDLSADGDSIWIIAGPAKDQSEPFQLRRIAISALEPSKVIGSDFVKELPNSSEGLAVSGKIAYVVIDGDKGDGHKCKESASYMILTLP